jgi:hypothetical protein
MLKRVSLMNQGVVLSAGQRVSKVVEVLIGGITTVLNVKCMPLLVLNVGSRLKFRFVQVVTVRFIAGNALIKIIRAINVRN